MNALKVKKPFFSLLLSWIALLGFGYWENPLYARQLYGPYENTKRFVQLDLSVSSSTRTVVEETIPGVQTEGDAVSTRVLARLAVKPWSPLELYAQGGTGNLEINEFDDFKGGYRFAYGGGIKLVLYEYPGRERFQFLVQGDTLQFTTTDHVLNTDISPDPVKEKIRWREYTVQGISLWRMDRWEPYLGARFSWLNSTDTIEGVGTLDLKEDSNLGLVAGSSIYLDPRENFAFNVEVTLVDQAFIKVGIQLWY